MRNVFISLFAFIIFLFISCATGSAVITGTVRDPISPEAVEIMAAFPAEYEVIAFVEASSDSGMTAQGDYNYAKAELKKQAAKIGANAVVITSIGKTVSGITGISSGNSFSASTNQAHCISGQAIYYQKNK